MKTKIALFVAAGLALAGSSAFAAKACEELKTEIAAKLDAKKVTGYTLDIVEAEKAGDAKVVGSCEGGAKKIVYTKK
jgi:predicted lipoprotein with Yx(FWY)xxD motif